MDVGTGPGRPRVLVVDDEPDALLLVRWLLDTHGVDVIEATQGEEALVRARDEHPDLIITDLLMPVMPGLQLIEELNSDPSTCDIPVVVFSALVSEPHVSDARAGGCVDYVIKPTAWTEFADRVLSHIPAEAWAHAEG